MTAPDHNRIILAAARAGLQPLGLVQKGRSRLWLDDHGWWVGLVEFQPSGFGKGSYLNVAAHWLWYDKDHFSFDYGPSGGESRLDGFRSFEDPSEFAQAAAQLTQTAADAIAGLRNELPSVERAARRLARSADGEIWSRYHAAVAAGLAGHTWRAKWHFRAMERVRHDASWTMDLQQRARALAQQLADTGMFRSEVHGIIAAARQRLQLPAWNGAWS